MDTTTPIPEGKPTVQAISKDESNETENFKLEQISVNTLGKTTGKNIRPNSNAVMIYSHTPFISPKKVFKNMLIQVRVDINEYHYCDI